MMRLICPSCGAVASADAWLNDAAIRESIRIMTTMPNEVANQTLGYLGLFRASQTRGLGWSRVIRLLTELNALAKQPYVQRGRDAARPNCPAYWAETMQTLCDRPPKKLPLKTHGYLVSMVYDLADAADREADKRRNQAERTGAYQAQTGRDGGEPEPLSVDMMRGIRRQTVRRSTEK